MKSGKTSQSARYKRTREDHHTERAEDYVEVIAELIELKGEARVVELAKTLGVSHVTVNRAVSRLKDSGLVTAEPYRSIYLTESGKKLAEACHQRHTVVFDFLKAVGVPEEIANLDAEGIEHHVSQETLKAFSRFLQEKNGGKRSPAKGKSS